MQDVNVTKVVSDEMSIDRLSFDWRIERKKCNNLHIQTIDLSKSKDWFLLVIFYLLGDDLVVSVDSHSCPEMDKQGLFQLMTDVGFDDFTPTLLKEICHRFEFADEMLVIKSLLLDACKEGDVCVKDMVDLLLGEFIEADSNYVLGDDAWFLSLILGFQSLLNERYPNFNGHIDATIIEYRFSYSFRPRQAVGGGAPWYQIRIITNYYSFVTRQFQLQEAIIGSELVTYVNTGNMAVNVSMANLVGNWSLDTLLSGETTQRLGVKSKCILNHGIRLRKSDNVIVYTIQHRLHYSPTERYVVIESLRQADKYISSHTPVFRQWLAQIAPVLANNISQETIAIHNNRVVNALNTPTYIKESVYSLSLPLVRYYTNDDFINVDVRTYCLQELRSVRRRLKYVSDKDISEGHKEKLLLDCLLFNIHFPKAIRSLLLKMPVQRKDNLLKLKQMIKVFGLGRVHDDLNKYISYANTFEQYSSKRCLSSNEVEFVSPTGLVGGQDPRVNAAIYTNLAPLLIKYELIMGGLSEAKADLFFPKDREIGFSYHHWLRIVSDTIQSLVYMRTYNINCQRNIRSAKNYQAIHDVLTDIHSKHYTAHRNEVLRMPVVSKYEYFETDDFVIRPIKQVVEMNTIGQRMNHCVGSYMDKQLSGNIEIVVITDKKDDYLVCIEVSKFGVILQAKMAFDVEVYNNPTLEKLLFKWAKLNNLKTDSPDISKQIK